MKQLSLVVRCGLAVMVTSLLPSAAGAQVSTARISGRVVDSTGTPLPGVTITAIEDKQQQRLISAGDGTFAFSSLSPGSYVVTAALPGFVTQRHRVEVRAGEASVTDFAIRPGCIAVVTVSSHQRLVEPRIPPRSDLFAHIRIDELSDESSASDPDCRNRYRATLLGSVRRPSYRGPSTGTIAVLLDTGLDVASRKEYVLWLAWRPEMNAFDSGTEIETLLRPVENGQVESHSGPCLDVQIDRRNSCHPSTYTVDELFAIFKLVLDR